MIKILVVTTLFLSGIHASIAYAGPNPNNDRSDPITSDRFQSQQSESISVPRISEMKKNVVFIKRTVAQTDEMLSSPRRPLAPPFPDGLCNGRLVTLPPSEHYLLDSNISGNRLLLPPRDIQVWLPPDYDNHPDMRFPVLYCHDGQNAM